MIRNFGYSTKKDKNDANFEIKIMTQYSDHLKQT